MGVTNQAERENSKGILTVHELWIKTAVVCLSIALVPICPAASKAQIVTCPTGTYLSIDELGKPNCLRTDDHSIAIIQASPTVICPGRTYPTVDEYGSRVCKSIDQRRPTYYGYPPNGSTSQVNEPDSGNPNSSSTISCPIGTFPAGVGAFGNQICRHM